MLKTRREPLLRQEELKARVEGSEEYGGLAERERIMLDLLVKGHSPIEGHGYAALSEWRALAGVEGAQGWRLSREALERLRELGFIRAYSGMSQGELAVASWGELASPAP